MSRLTHSRIWRGDPYNVAFLNQLPHNRESASMTDVTLSIFPFIRFLASVAANPDREQTETSAVLLHFYEKFYPVGNRIKSRRQ